MAESGKFDIVKDYRAARAQLPLDKYDRYLAEHIAARVARLLGNRDAEDRGRANQGDAHAAVQTAVSSGFPRRRARE